MTSLRCGVPRCLRSTDTWRTVIALIFPALKNLSVVAIFRRLILPKRLHGISQSGVASGGTDTLGDGDTAKAV